MGGAGSGVSSEKLRPAESAVPGNLSQLDKAHANEGRLVHPGSINIGASEIQARLQYGVAAENPDRPSLKVADAGEGLVARVVEQNVRWAPQRNIGWELPTVSNVRCGLGVLHRSGLGAPLRRLRATASSEEPMPSRSAVERPVAFGPVRVGRRASTSAVPSREDRWAPILGGIFAGRFRSATAVPQDGGAQGSGPPLWSRAGNRGKSPRDSPGSGSPGRKIEDDGRGHQARERGAGSQACLAVTVSVADGIW